MTIDELHKFMLARPKHNPPVEILYGDVWGHSQEPILTCYDLEQVRWKPSPKKVPFMPDGVFAVKGACWHTYHLVTQYSPERIRWDGREWSLTQLIEQSILWSRIDDCKTWNRFEKEADQ